MRVANIAKSGSNSFAKTRKLAIDSAVSLRSPIMNIACAKMSFCFNCLTASLASSRVMFFLKVLRVDSSEFSTPKRIQWRPDFLNLGRMFLFLTTSSHLA